MNDRPFIAENRYLQAAQLGKADAQYNYARMCELGDGAPLNCGEAARWYLLAAD